MPIGHVKFVPEWALNQVNFDPIRPKVGDERPFARDYVLRSCEKYKNAARRVASP